MRNHFFLWPTILTTRNPRGYEFPFWFSEKEDREKYRADPVSGINEDGTRLDVWIVQDFGTFYVRLRQEEIADLLGGLGTADDLRFYFHA